MKPAVDEPDDPLARSLADGRCRPMRGQAPMSATEVARHLGALSGWSVDRGTLCKRFDFDDYAQTLAFVAAVGWMALRQDHHPDLRVDHAGCSVCWSTHDVGGLSMNDFVCAARTDALR